MASGSYAKKSTPQEPMELQTYIPPRTTRQLEVGTIVEEVAEKPTMGSFMTKALRTTAPPNRPVEVPQPKVRKIVDEVEPHPLVRHIPWLRPLLICLVCAVIFAGVLISAGIFQRHDDAQVVNFTNGGKVYDLQVGGGLADSWQGNAPLPPKVPLPTNTGPYSVLGKPTISVDFINQVLTSYNSPAAGKGQALYDMGKTYGIDPAFALAFFMHESSFGTAGEARSSLSLGNLRCIPNALCKDNYAWFNTWEDGFEAWYKLIRNLYVAQWGLTTVDRIIPVYAPTSDHNNERAYIASLKHALDTWHAGILRP